MAQAAIADKRILVIEDKIKTLDYELDILKSIHPSTREKLGIGALQLDSAMSVDDANVHLESATECPYDLVLLDLNLPVRYPGDDSESLDNGFSLLATIGQNPRVKGVIVVSAYDTYKNVRSSFRGGAADFLDKPPTQASLEPAVLNTLSRLMTEESEQLLNQRIRNLVAYAEIGQAHTYKLVFNSLLQGITEASDNIEQYARERFDIDREKDNQDLLIQSLRAHEQAIAKARREWTGLQVPISKTAQGPEVGYVGQMLDDILHQLKPGLVVKRIALDRSDFDDRPVHVFENDVEAVLREIIAGILCELPNYGVEREIKIKCEFDDSRATVTFQDNLDPLPAESVIAINENRRILPDSQFGRVWGLSVVQHVALRGGGELVVRNERGRNIIDYYLPLAEHA